MSDKYTPKWCAEECVEASAEIARLINEREDLKAEVERLTRERDEAREEVRGLTMIHEDECCLSKGNAEEARDLIDAAVARAEKAERERDEAREMAAQFCEQAAEWSGKLNASLTEQMRENCDACKEMAPAFTNKALRIASECREVLGEVLDSSRYSDAERSFIFVRKIVSPGCLARAIALLAGNEGEGCAECERLRGIVEQLCSVAEECAQDCDRHDVEDNVKAQVAGIHDAVAEARASIAASPAPQGDGQPAGLAEMQRVYGGSIPTLTASDSSGMPAPQGDGEKGKVGG